MTYTRVGSLPRTMVFALLSVAACSPQAGGSDAGSASSDASGQEPAASTPAGVVVPVGTSMEFALDEAVSTETHHEGDLFTAKLRSGVSDVEGSTAIPEGTESRWEVTRSTTDGGQALLAFQLKSINVDGDWVPVSAEVTEADLRTDEQDTGTESAAKVGIGAAAGAIIGQVLGKDTESTLTGAGVGAVVGAAVALSTRGGKAMVPADATVTVRLDEDLVLS